MESLKTMLLPLGEAMVDVGKVLELKARCPLSPPGAPLMRGRRAEGCGVAVVRCFLNARIFRG